MIQVKSNFSKKVKKYFKAQCTLFHSSNYDIAKHILSKLLLKEKPMKKNVILRHQLRKGIRWPIFR